MENFAALREMMVTGQLVARGVRDPAVLAAMREVPREEFVPAHLASRAYDDCPQPIAEGQTISQPYMVACMAEFLELARRDRVLEIGTGSGYAAAILSRIVDEVHSIERLAGLAESARERLFRLGYRNVHVHLGDGSLGWPELAPYDAIVVTAGAPAVPHSLKAQLAVGGRLVIPVGPDPRFQSLIRIRRLGADDYRRENLMDVMFVPLIGSEGWENR
jgi:protein-L-isoaspartate(D-aspartate) O-methyltransferase